MAIEKSIILFDGHCNLCNGFVNFILKKDKTKLFQFVALQSEKGKEFLAKFKIPSETDSVVLIIGNKIYLESDAAIEIVRVLPTPWNLMQVLKIVPKKLRDWIYKWIAGNRYRWFGKRDACRMV